MKNVVVLLFLVNTLFASAQKEALNNYKYIIVDNQYEFQGEANEYRWNELVVFELQKLHFTAFRNSEILPVDLNRGECNALQLKIDKSGTLRVNFVLRLENCIGATVFTTKEGVGKTKSNQKAYFEALRDAMTSLEEVNYEYTPLKSIAIDAPGLLIKEVEKPVQNSLSSNIVPEETPDFEENVAEAAVITTPYEFVSKEGYALMRSAKGFLIFDNNLPIGVALIKNDNAYLVHTSEFAGVGYMQQGKFVIEYINNKIEQVIEFVNVP
jgi:hypothetical protein